MNFDAAFELLIGHEGGYVNDPSDPGGETKFGISRAAYPKEDIANLTLSRAKELYFRDYWRPAGCDAVPGLLRLHLFDYAVHSGPKNAVKALQKIVQEFPDGIIGPKTLGAIDAWDIRDLALALSLQRLEDLTAKEHWNSFSRGWTRRLIANIRLLLEKPRK